MAEIKIGYRAVFYKGNERTITYVIRETYEESVKDISEENEKIEKYPNMIPFTHAQVEKVYYRH